MSKTCSHPGCNHDLFSKGLCMIHWRQKYAKPLKRVYEGEKKIYQKPPRKRKPIQKVSDKRAEQNSLYAKKREDFLKRHPKCEIAIEGCWIKSSQVHHTEGRDGHRFLDENTWKAACNGPCHDYWTRNSAQAIAEGHSVTRITPVVRTVFINKAN